MGKITSYINRTFGRITVLSEVQASNGSNNGGLWHCKCSCGKEFDCEGYKLHWRQSCGCMLSENALKVQYNRRKFDKVTESSEYLIHKNNALQRGMLPMTKINWLNIVYLPCFYCGDIDIRNRALAKSYIKSRGKSLKEGDIDKYALPLNGVDRIDSKRGYEKDNIIPCCGTCNVMKNGFTQELFMSKIKKIYESHFS